MNMHMGRRSLYTVGIALLTLFWSVSNARAVPSYARQSGLPCSGCHTAFPELNSFGRQFKLTGYTFTTTPTVQSGDPNFLLNTTPPISAMTVIAYTQTAKAVPEAAVEGGDENSDKNSQNGTVQLPQELSLFYAGRIGEGIGTFIQLTYESAADHFSIDNVDLRFVGQSSLEDGSLIYGITVNNNPTIQDLWNSTPAWGAPDMGSGVAPSPEAATLIDGTLGQVVAGIGGYMALNRAASLWYGELSVYRSAQPGVEGQLTANPEGEPVIAGVAPYLRLAHESRLEGGSTWELGLLGMTADTYTPGYPVTGSATSTRTDLGVDTQYQNPLGEGSYLTVHAIWIQESQQWDKNVGAQHSKDNLQTARVWADYNQQNSFLYMLQYFSTSGDSDKGLYAPGPVSGSKNGSPNSSGVIVEASYMPALNVRMTAQYVNYIQFNGGGSNYDGNGRDAADNNTLFLNLWFVF
jgi:hypothetical protein